MVPVANAIIEGPSPFSFRLAVFGEIPTQMSGLTLAAGDEDVRSVCSRGWLFSGISSSLRSVSFCKNGTAFSKIGSTGQTQNFDRSIFT